MSADLWQYARKQLADFEQRSAELSLELGTEKGALDRAEREIKQLEAERATLLKRTQEAEAGKAAAQRAAGELQAAAARAAKDSTVLQKHLELLQSSRQQASKQMEADHQRYQQHVSQLRTQLLAYCENVGAAQAAA